MRWPTSHSGFLGRVDSDSKGTGWESIWVSKIKLIHLPDHNSLWLNALFLTIHTNACALRFATRMSADLRRQSCAYDPGWLRKGTEPWAGTLPLLPTRGPTSVRNQPLQRRLLLPEAWKCPFCGCLLESSLSCCPAQPMCPLGTFLGFLCGSRERAPFWEAESLGHSPRSASPGWPGETPGTPKQKQFSA